MAVTDTDLEAIDSAVIRKYSKRTLGNLVVEAQRHFNAYIRSRDLGRECISCGGWHKLEAGHFYSAGKYQALRFDETNVHGQCRSCNYFKSGNLLEYRKRIINRISTEQLKRLDEVAAITMRGYKLERIFVISIILKYKNKLK